MSDRKIAWIDVETTSLDVTDPRVLMLELALVITDQDLNELQAVSFVISHTQAEVDSARWCPRAAEMHRENNLIAECVGEGVPLWYVDQELQRILDWYTPEVDKDPIPGSGSPDPRAPIWGGCSPWLDRTIVRRDLPRVYERIHYRTIDSTSLRLAGQLWAGIDTERASKPHRALEDARAACKLAGRFRQALQEEACHHLT